MTMDARALARFMAKVDRGGDCWLWLAGRNNGGYGSFGLRGKYALAHRVSYEHFIGPIPDGMTIDHLCHNDDLACAGDHSCPHRACVNPAHLEAVTQRTNDRRGHGLTAMRARQTHCKRGHEFTLANTIPDNGGRRCRTCNIEWQRRRHSTDQFRAKRRTRYAAERDTILPKIKAYQAANRERINARRRARHASARAA